MKILKILLTTSKNKKNIIFLLFFINNLFSHNKIDSVYTSVNHIDSTISTDTTFYSDIMITSKQTKDPVKAALYSAVIPGLGQSYNGQYWKTPIVWGLIAVPAYLFYLNNEICNKIRTEYKTRKLGLEPDYLSNISDERLVSYLQTFERDRDLWFLVTILAYTMNIIDANVSAHLIEFDINDVSFKPGIMNDKNNIGLSLKINF